MSEPTLLQIFLQPKQLELLNLVENSPATWIGDGGSRGGAKSYSIDAVMLLRRLTYPATRGCILRRTWDLVRENHVEKMKLHWPWLIPFWHASDHEFVLPNKSTITFRFAETEKDVDGMIGKEYMDFFVDQGEAFSEREHSTMKSCTRWTGVPDSRCKYVIAFNPGDIGHAFLKRIFYDHAYRGVCKDCDQGGYFKAGAVCERCKSSHIKLDELAVDYTFLQVFGWDNVEWSRDALKADNLTAFDYYHRFTNDQRFDYYVTRSAYGRDMNAKPPAIRIGWLLGRMDKFGGQYFDVFSESRHVHHCAPEPWSNCWLGIDWGFGHDSACEWLAQTGQKRTVVYREFCAAGRSPRALAQEISDRTPPSERQMLKRIYLSHDAFARRDERETIAAQMGIIFRQNQLPWPLMASRDQSNRRPSFGGTLIYDMLAADELVIDPSCEKLISTLPMISRDKDNLEKTVGFEGDDSYKALVYGLLDRMQPSEKPREMEVREEAERIPDKMARWMFLTRNIYRGKAHPLEVGGQVPPAKAGGL